MSSQGRVSSPCHHAPAADEAEQWPEGYRCPICEPTSGPTCAFCWVQGEPPKSPWLWHHPSECPESTPASTTPDTP